MAHTRVLTRGVTLFFLPAHDAAHLPLLDTGLEGREVAVNQILLGHECIKVVAGASIRCLELHEKVSTRG